MYLARSDGEPLGDRVCEITYLLEPGNNQNPEEVFTLNFIIKDTDKRERPPEQPDPTPEQTDQTTKPQAPTPQTKDKKTKNQQHPNKTKENKNKTKSDMSLGVTNRFNGCLLYTNPRPRDGLLYLMPSSD